MIIVGGGIGGLALALSLRDRDLDARVIERAPVLSAVSVGGGLHLWPNGMRAVRKLGLADDVLGLGGEASTLRRAEFCNWRGRLLGSFDVAEMERRLGEPTVGVARSELHALLAERLGAARIRLGAACTGFAEDADGVVAHLDGGAEEKGDVLVGADGLYSTVRAQLHGTGAPRSAGLSHLQAVTSCHDGTPPGLLRVYFGPGARFLFYPLGRDRQYWEAAATAEPGEQVSTELFADWPAPIPLLLHSTDPAAISGGHSYDRPRLRSWGRRRATLLGDAAHPMTNSLAQGANQALEDAVVLAESLAARSDPVQALRAYEDLRRKRTSVMARQSIVLSRAVRLRRPVAIGLREAVMSKVLFTPRGFRHQLKDLDYSFD